MSGAHTHLVDVGDVGSVGQSACQEGLEHSPVQHHISSGRVVRSGAAGLPAIAQPFLHDQPDLVWLKLEALFVIVTDQAEHLLDRHHLTSQLLQDLGDLLGSPFRELGLLISQLDRPLDRLAPLS